VILAVPTGRLRRRAFGTPREQFQSFHGNRGRRRDAELDMLSPYRHNLHADVARDDDFFSDTSSED
jgi:hypothetical protein